MYGKYSFQKKKMAYILVLTIILLYLSHNHTIYYSLYFNSSPVLIVFSLASQMCSFSIGEEIHRQSFLNRHLYASLKSYDLLFNRRQPYKNITGNYNKIAVLHEIIINETLKDKRDQHEWIFYDVIFNDMSFNIPKRKVQRSEFCRLGRLGPSDKTRRWFNGF